MYISMHVGFYNEPQAGFLGISGSIQCTKQNEVKVFQCTLL